MKTPPLITETDMTTAAPNMAGLLRLQVLRSYCDYVEEHLRNVAKAWVILQDACKQDKTIWNDFDFWSTHTMIENHDLSKMEAAEFTAYAEWFYGPYGRQYDLAVDFEYGKVAHRAVKAAFYAAWEHHKEHNPHHWQNWTQSAESFPGEAACHLMCMVADWIAMGLKFGDTAETFYERERDKIDLPAWAVDYLQQIFAALRDHNARLDRQEEA